MFWWSDAFDGAFDVEQDQDLEDFKETESPPVQKKMKKLPLNNVRRQAEEKPRIRHVLNKIKKKHVVTHIATIKDVFSQTGIHMSCCVSSRVSFSKSILPYTHILAEARYSYIKHSISYLKSSTAT